LSVSIEMISCLFTTFIVLHVLTHPCISHSYGEWVS
jgi:hypothetical protein